MQTTLTRVRRGAYVDSVTLLQVTAEVLHLPGVTDAGLVMATDLNRDVLRESRLLVGDALEAGPNDLVMAVRASDEASARVALEQAEALLSRRRPAASGTHRSAHRSLHSAHRASPDARIAVISVPGEFAAAEARQALVEGLHVFLFSDNVSLDDEVQLKRAARDRDLLLMGPDCGTAILNGVGFGFANVVRRGSVGIVGASGTGIQEVAALVHQAGGGVSHAIGTGSRDLQERVGGITTLQAIRLLRQDAATRTIVLVSKKPSDHDVAANVLRALAATGKRAIAYLQASDVEVPMGVIAVGTLADTARLASDGADAASPSVPPGRLADGQRQVRGLFCGGTLAQEALAVLGPELDVDIVDFGDDTYTRGRAHPMIDPTLRNQAIVHAGRDSHVAVLLLDFVLGFGAHPDPVGAALPAIREAMSLASAAGRDLAVIAHVVGTEQDPQNSRRQEDALRAAGVQVYATNALMAEVARQMLAGVAA